MMTPLGPSYRDRFESIDVEIDDDETDADELEIDVDLSTLQPLAD